MSEHPLRNMENALTQMLTAISTGTYRAERVHIEADLTYLLAETRRAIAEGGK